MADRTQGRGGSRGDGKGKGAPRKGRGPVAPVGGGRGKPGRPAGGGAPGKRVWTPRADADRTSSKGAAARPNRRPRDADRADAKRADTRPPRNSSGPKRYGEARPANFSRDQRPARGDETPGRRTALRSERADRRPSSDERRPRAQEGDARPYKKQVDRSGGDRRPRPAPAVPAPAPAALAAGSGGVQRIAKVMARAGLCSRRDAEGWIAEGRVSVNGVVLTGPARNIGVGDRVVVDGQELPPPERTRLFLFHKPRGLVTTDHDPESRMTIFDHLRDHWPDLPRVVSIGRLDINTEGLLLLTNDGGLARVLELPATGWMRRYRVRANGATDQAVLDKLRDGITIDGVDYAGIEAKLDRVQGANSWMTIGLREGKNREIKRVLEHLGLAVNRLIRMSFGPFQLNDLFEGAVEEVRTRVLRDQLGPALAEAADVDFDSPTAAERAPPPRLRDERDVGPRQRTDRGAAPRPRADRDVSQRPPRERRRDDAVEAAPHPVRERPERGTRKHVTALRSVAEQDRESGPRTRITRSETADRKGRAVKVERLVKAGSGAAGPAEDSRNGRRFGAARRQRDIEAGGQAGKRSFKPKEGSAPHRGKSPSRNGKPSSRQGGPPSRETGSSPRPRGPGTRDGKPPRGR